MILVYGAYGYTGELIAREAARREVEFVVAGRNGTKTRGLGIELGVDSRVFELDQARENLDGIDVVLNCAGPFADTCDPLVEACLETGTHYADLTGEVSVFEALAERDREAEQAGVCLLPGVGFDVTPTDCLAGHLHERLPEATHLRLGFEAPTGLSGGTIATALEHAAGGGGARRDGRLVDVPLGADTRTVDFGAGPRDAVSVPLGDISTAYYTTGIPNIDTYLAVPGRLKPLVRAGRHATGLLRVDPVREGLQSLARALVDGPSAAARERGQAFVWGEAEADGETVTSRLVTPETYALTVDAATTATTRLDGAELSGFHTPASAFDPNFVLELDGVEGFFDEAFPDLV